MNMGGPGGRSEAGGGSTQPQSNNNNSVAGGSGNNNLSGGNMNNNLSEGGHLLSSNPKHKGGKSRTNPSTAPHDGQTNYELYNDIMTFLTIYPNLALLSR